MRRRRLPTRRSTGTSLAVAERTTDLQYLRQIVEIRFPVAAAKVYLQRNMGQPVTVRLVEARRGEAVGTVRLVEVHHANGGAVTWVRAERVLANGEPASFFVPDHLVTVQSTVEGAAARHGSLSLEDQVVLHVPVRGYLRYLPGVYQGEGPVNSRELVRTRDSALARWGSGLPEEQAREVVLDEDPLRRFLFIFQHMMTTITARIDHIVDLTDPVLCEPKFLPWLSSWVGFELDESLPVNQQRELVRRAILLFRTRGTRLGIQEMVRVLTSAPVRVVERARPNAVVLGQATLIGGRDAVERYYRDEPVGSHLMSDGERADTSFFSLLLEPRDRFRGRFGERAAGTLRQIVGVVSRERPVHLLFTVHFDRRPTADLSPASPSASAKRPT